MLRVGDGNESGFHRIDGHTLVGTQVLNKNHVLCDCRKGGEEEEGGGERKGGMMEERREREKEEGGRGERERGRNRREGEKKRMGLYLLFSNVSCNQHSLLDLC